MEPQGNKSRGTDRPLTRKARGRRETPPEEEKQMQFIVRPFRRVVERGSAQPASDVTGTIEAGAFVFSVDGARFRIPTVRHGDDEHDQFAVIEESEQAVDRGFRLAVEVDPPEYPYGPSGCAIRLFKPHRDLAATQEVHPHLNVLLPPEASLSIHFRSNGSVCGSGVLFNTPYPPGAAAPEVKH